MIWLLVAGAKAGALQTGCLAAASLAGENARPPLQPHPARVLGPTWSVWQLFQEEDRCLKI